MTFELTVQFTPNEREEIGRSFQTDRDFLLMLDRERGTDSVTPIKRVFSGAPMTGPHVRECIDLLELYVGFRQGRLDRVEGTPEPVGASDDDLEQFHRQQRFFADQQRGWIDRTQRVIDTILTPAYHTLTQLPPYDIVVDGVTETDELPTE